MRLEREEEASSSGVSLWQHDPDVNLKLRFAPKSSRVRDCVFAELRIDRECGSRRFDRERKCVAEEHERDLIVAPLDLI